MNEKDARELGEAFIIGADSALSLYGELRRLHANDSGPGYPSLSLGGGGSNVVSDREGDIAADLADHGDRDPVHQALIQLEVTLDECERKIRSAVPKALALPAIRAPKPKTRDVCVTFGEPTWIVGLLQGAKCGDCRRSERAKIYNLSGRWQKMPKRAESACGLTE